MTTPNELADVCAKIEALNPTLESVDQRQIHEMVRDIQRRTHGSLRGGNDL